MKNNFNIEILIERAMIAFDCRTQRQLSELFGVSPENFSAKKKRGTLTKLIEKEAFRRDINYDWIKTGTGNMKTEGVHEMHAPYSVAASNNNTPAQSKPLLELTADVLSTDSVYRSALEHNVKAFHDAVEARKQLAICEAKLTQSQQENIELKQQLNEKDLYVEKLQAIISGLRAGKSGANGVS